MDESPHTFNRISSGVLSKAKRKEVRMQNINIKQKSTSLTPEQWDRLTEKIDKLYAKSGMRKGELIIRALIAGLEILEKNGSKQPDFS